MCKFTISTFQFMQKFRTDESARVFLEKRRWPNGVECPKSQAKQGISSTMANGRSHIGLQKWLYTMYLVATA